MSKRAHPQESREERWVRKMKMYEEKIAAKRRRVIEGLPVLPPEPNGGLQGLQGLPLEPNGGSQIEENTECNEGLPARPLAPVGIVDESPAFVEGVALADNHDDREFDAYSVFDEFQSQMTETTACTSPNSIPCEDKNENIATDDFDPNLIRELGDIETDPVEFGENLQPDVAARFQKILLEGLKKETKEDLLKKYPFPRNAPLTKGPTLNPEIGAMLVENCKLRDKRLLTKQDQLGKALSALGKALTGLLKKTPDIPDVIRTLNDAGTLLADSHYAETDTRRSVIIPLIDKSLTDPFKDRKRDSFLFGEKLGDLVKDSRGIKKTGQLIQPTTSTGSNLNGKGPSSRGARQQRGNQTYHRAGGPRASSAPAYQYQYYHYPSRRRAAPAPPPPLSNRRQTALPPPMPAPARRPPPLVQRPSTSRQT